MPAIVRLALVAATALAAVFMVTGPAAAAGPSITVFPVPAVAGQQVSVVGHGFCASAGCSTVTVTIETTTVASGVTVGGDGGFTTSLTLGVVPGDHDVTAVQHTPSGDQSATAHLIVLPNDNRTAPPPTTVRPPSATTPAGTRTSAGTGNSGAGPGAGTTTAGGQQPGGSTPGRDAQPAKPTSSALPWTLGGLGIVLALGAGAVVGLRMWRRRSSSPS